MSDELGAGRHQWKKLAAGVYDDEQGGLHLELEELLEANGFANTPENRAMLEQTWRDFCVQQGIPMTVVVA